MGAQLGAKVRICVPYCPDDGRRDRLWAFTRQWICDNYKLGPVVVCDAGGEFSRAKSRNMAADTADDWDVLLFHDADTLAHPDAVERAIQTAHVTNQMVIAGDAFIYMDQASSDRILAGGPLFPRPVSFDEHGCYARPCSGVFAVGRELWEATGGYVESLQGWGYEDLVFLTMCGIFGQGNTWVPNHTMLHLWHEPAPRTTDTHRNRALWEKLARHKAFGDTAGALGLLRSIGHEVPA
jgi:hypothetical protein